MQNGLSPKINNHELELFIFSPPKEHWNVNRTRIIKYTMNMSHRGLKENKTISAQDLDMLKYKAAMQTNKWLEKWEKVELKRKKQELKEANLNEANRRTQELNDLFEEIDKILTYTLSIDDTIDWNTLKRNDEYSEPKPQNPDIQKIPPKPNKNSAQFNPRFSLLEKLLKQKKLKKIELFETKYNSAMEKWENDKSGIERSNSELEKQYAESIRKWEHERKEFWGNQKAHNEKIERMKDSYHNKNADAITEYCEMVLNNSNYPDIFSQNFELEYHPENEILIVEYQLPSIECFPTVREVKYVATRKEFKEQKIPVAQLKKMFDDTMYKITLRSIHELFEADRVNALQAISFNGWVTAINKATGKEENNCILTIHVKKDEFMEIELANVDPKMCFKNLKGIASSQLSTLTPIQPILQISKTDKRFIDGNIVVDTMDQSANIAAMDWEDFEHLIREIFEKEFSSNGGEVKVTQASRDGGVDAIAFDPDPIKGGKIVIQAKRYTNTVGVSAVRDLFGTVMNEGAIKGILVTTADYGPDAYNFAKDKPLTLINGSNLLYLLERHGHNFTIDLKKAKKMLADQNEE